MTGRHRIDCNKRISREARRSKEDEVAIVPGGHPGDAPVVSADNFPAPACLPLNERALDRDYGYLFLAIAFCCTLVSTNAVAGGGLQLWGADSHRKWTHMHDPELLRTRATAAASFTSPPWTTHSLIMRSSCSLMLGNSFSMLRKRMNVAAPAANDHKSTTVGWGNMRLSRHNTPGARGPQPCLGLPRRAQAPAAGSGEDRYQRPTWVAIAWPLRTLRLDEGSAHRPRRSDQCQQRHLTVSPLEDWLERPGTRLDFRDHGCLADIINAVEGVDVHGVQRECFQALYKGSGQGVCRASAWSPRRPCNWCRPRLAADEDKMDRYRNHREVVPSQESPGMPNLMSHT